MPEQILIIGKNSKISKFFSKKIIKKRLISPSKKQWDMSRIDFSQKEIDIIKSSNKILLLQSVISSKKFLDRNTNDIGHQININFLSIIKICEIALKFNKNVKIVILGSESAIKGSHDIVYGLMKTALHQYVKERKINFPNQQLVCIAPSTIIDANITIRRKDKNNVKRSIKKNPKKRGLKSKEISELVYDIFYNITDYLSNTVISVDGGKFARM
jgi:hypothetical protein